MKLHPTLRMLAASLALSTTFAAHAATTLYGTLGAGSGVNSTLVSIDVGTGAVTTIGSVGFTVNGLTWDASTGTLYGSAAGDVGLLTINTSTGAGTLVGTGFGSAASGCGAHNVLLTANAAGAMYGWCDPSSDDLMSINKATGVATLVGDSGLGTARHGLAFDAFGTLYMHNIGGNFYTMNTGTGAATLVGNSGVSTAHHGDFNDDNNYYYGLGFMDGTIHILDLVGGGTTIGSISTGRTDLHTLAFATPGTSVPVPAPLALIGLALAGVALTRRKAA